jgi:hypothetical protein
VDPALAFKLEMHRLQTHYEVKHIPSRNLHLHIYFAEGRVRPLQAPGKICARPLI